MFGGDDLVLSGEVGSKPEVLVVLLMASTGFDSVLKW